MWLLRFLMLLALIVWIGGIIFFAFVLAPTLFGVLPTTKLAGDVVNATLTKLHWMGLISGVVFLICSCSITGTNTFNSEPFAASHILIVLMLVFTAVSQFGITPRMRSIRATLQIADLPLQDEDFVLNLTASMPGLRVWKAAFCFLAWRGGFDCAAVWIKQLAISRIATRPRSACSTFRLIQSIRHSNALANC